MTQDASDLVVHHRAAGLRAYSTYGTRSYAGPSISRRVLVDFDSRLFRNSRWNVVSVELYVLEHLSTG